MGDEMEPRTVWKAPPPTKRARLDSLLSQLEPAVVELRKYEEQVIRLRLEIQDLMEE